MREQGDRRVPAGFTVRPARHEDLEPVVEMVAAAEAAVLGAVDVEPQITRDEWRRPRFDPALHAWVIEDRLDRVVAAGQAFPEADPLVLDAVGRVHPGARGLGLGAALIAEMGNRARAAAGRAGAGAVARVQNVVSASDEAAKRLLATSRFAPVRSWLHMALDLPAPPPPEPPEGVRLRKPRPGVDERTIHEVLEEGFRGTWSYVPTTFEDWAAVSAQGLASERDVWRLAEAGGRVVGVLWALPMADRWWISDVAVLPGWRRRGIGEALLRHAFAAIAERGGPGRVMLNVDARNETGAVRLYERVGMRVHRRWDVYERSYPAP